MTILLVSQMKIKAGGVRILPRDEISVVADFRGGNTLTGYQKEKEKNQFSASCVVVRVNNN